MRLIGNYVSEIDTSNLEFLRSDDNMIKGKLKNLQITVNQYSLYCSGSVSKFMETDINHSNIDLFINAISDLLGVPDIIYSKVLRLDICTDIQTSEKIALINSKLVKLRYYKKNVFDDTIYFQTSKKKHRGTKLVIYQKGKNVIRLELRTFKNSKYHINRLMEVEKHFLRLCEVIIKLYSNIVKTGQNNQLKMIKNTKDLSEVKTKLILELGGEKAINKLLELIDSRSHGYKLKAKILNEVSVEVPCSGRSGRSLGSIGLELESSLKNTINL